MTQIEMTADLALKTILRAAKRGDVLLTQRGRPVAVVREVDDEDLQWYAQEQSTEFRDSIARAHKQVQEGRTVSHQELKRRWGKQTKA